MLAVHQTALVKAKDESEDPADSDKSWCSAGPVLDGWQPANLMYAEGTAPSSASELLENQGMDAVDDGWVVLLPLVVRVLAPLLCNIFQ